jgi:hypothetical protein
MKWDTGEIKRRSHKVGISLTSMKKAVKITKIKRRLELNSKPQKESLERLARPAPKRCPMYLKKTKKRRAEPTSGSTGSIWGISGG